MIYNRFRLFNRVLWAILLFFLPITSSPLVSRIFKSSSVAPLSLLPLVVLVITYSLPIILIRKTVPKPVVPLLLFALLAILSIGFSSFIDIPSFRGLDSLKSGLHDLLTLAIGLCFYLTTIFASEDSKSFKFSLFWLNLGGAILILYAILQFLVWRIFSYYPQFISKIQLLVSISNKLYDGRVTSFALEPSWLAHQLNVLYLPIWLAFTIQGASIYKRRLFKKFTGENLLLLGGLFTLAATLSRIGWMSIGGVIVYLLVRWANSWRKRLVVNTLLSSPQKEIVQSPFFSILFWLVLLFVIGLLGFSGTKLLSVLDPKRMASVFALFNFQKNGLLSWANRLEMAERFLYWMSAFYTFLAFPLLGVGLGNVGYFFSRNLPSFGYGSPEIMRQILFSSSLVNAKNLWARLLAETGIIGFAAFMAWIYQQLRISISLEKSDGNSVIKSMGLAGILITICLLIEGFSIDSFGLPYYWIGFGLVMGVYRFSQKSMTLAPEDH